MENREIKTSHLLFDEAPLIVRPELACRVGLNQAIILQQVHYWLENTRKSVKVKELENEYKYRDGRFWTYNTYDEWQEQFPFWSSKTISRAVAKLEDMGVLITNQSYNRNVYDQTKWYSIDYDKLDEIPSKSYVKERSEKAKKARAKVKKSDNLIEGKDTENPGKVSKEHSEQVTMEEVDMMQSDNLSNCTTTHEDNMSDCAITHKDNMSSSNETTCPIHEDNLSPSIPKTSFSKTSVSENTSLFSSSSSIKNESVSFIENDELSKEEEDEINNRLHTLGTKIAESKIMRTNRQINSVLELMTVRGLLDFDDKDIEKAIAHYQSECANRRIGQPPLFFVNGFEMKIDERYSYELGSKHRETKDKYKNMLSNVKVKDLPLYNWLED